MTLILKSAIAYGKLGPGQHMNINDAGISRRCASAATVCGLKFPSTNTCAIIYYPVLLSEKDDRTKPIVISGNASSKTATERQHGLHVLNGHLLFALASISDGTVPA